MNLLLAIATWRQPEWERCVRSWNHPYLLIERKGILPAYQEAFEELQGYDTIAFFHDDLVCHEPQWLQRVEAEFRDPQVALVGFAGAPGHGHPRMYDQPYHHSSMGRVGFRSNFLNAEQHGARDRGACDVTVLDGVALIVRRRVLEEAGGWPLGTPISYFMYAEWLCCTVRRLGYRIRYVGVSCEHLGGRSTGLNPDLNPDFEGEHRYLYSEFRDVLPGEVK